MENIAISIILLFYFNDPKMMQPLCVNRYVDISFLKTVPHSNYNDAFFIAVDENHSSDIYVLHLVSVLER